MENRTLIIAALSIVFSTVLFDTVYSQRNTAWIRGTTQNSHGFLGLKQAFINKGYLFEDYMNSSYTPVNGVATAADQVDGFLGSRADVLGIGHDHGGIVLRDLQLQNSNISAMILDGVPNQGSSAITAAIQADGPDGLTRAQVMIQDINNLKRGDACQDCNFTDAFESWIDDMKNADFFLNEIKAESPLINNLNEPANLPSVPFVVLYGTVKNLSLSSLMSSRGFPSGIDHYSKCYTEKVNRQRREIKEATTLTVINNTVGFFASILKFAGTLAGISNPLSVLSDFINSSRSNITNNIEAIRAEHRELSRILRCELANQVLAAEWQLFLQENSAIYEADVDIPFICDLDDCIEECELDMAWGDWEYTYGCDVYCEECTDGPTTITVLVTEANDGLLSESEQKLNGAVATIHLPETNHFQETSTSQDVVVNTFEDLFNGSAGAAFVVPK